MYDCAPVGADLVGVEEVGRGEVEEHQFEDFGREGRASDLGRGATHDGVGGLEGGGGEVALGGGRECFG